MLHNVEGITDEEQLLTFPKMSYSEMTSLTRCKRLWKYSYKDGLVPATTPSYFSKGRYLHGVAAELLRGSEDPDGVFQQVVEQMLEDGEDLSAIPDDEIASLNRLVVDATQNILDNSKEVLIVEEEFYVDLELEVEVEGKPVLLHGFADAVTVMEDGNLWLVEHKTASRAWSADQFNFSVQDVLYALAIEALTGRRVAGSTHVFYLNRKTDPLEYRNRFITDAMKANVFEQYRQAVEMREQLSVYPMEPLFGCGGCTFQAVCRAELAGTDPTYMLQTQFITREETEIE